MTRCDYSMGIQWSDEDGAYLVTLPEFGPSAVTHGSTYEEAARQGQDALESLINAYQVSGWALPEPVKFGSAVTDLCAGEQELDRLVDLESLSEVERLLQMLPGVKVEMSNPWVDGIKLRLAVSQESLALLAHSADFSNVDLFVGTVEPPRRFGERCDPEGLRYILWVPNDPGPVMPPSRLQKIGLFLACELKVRGLLDAAELDRLQTKWNAVVM